MKKLTVIVSGYNCEKSIKKCLYSILNQSYTNLQIIIIDDASEDDTFKICRKIANMDERVEIYRNHSNLGVSASRNTGLDHSKGDYITFVDTDDYLEKDMYKKLIEVFENPTIDISMCNFFMEYLEKDIRANKNSNYIYNKKELMNKIFLTDYFCGFVWNKIYKTSIIKKNKIFFKNNIHICEDLLFNCQYFSFIKKGFYTEDKLYHYIQHAKSSYNSLNYNSRWNTVVDAYEKIKLYIEEDNMNFEFSYLSAVLNLKERIVANKIRNENLIEVVNEKIKENEKRLLINKDLSISNKLKIIVKINAIYIFMILKKIKYNIKK